MEILQSTDKAIINWKSFSIDAGEKVTFQQPSASSVTLNRVTGADPSKIMGSLSANGTVMLVNPNGVVIGAGAKVDVGGLVATTANISDANFMAGKYQFDQALHQAERHGGERGRHHRQGQRPRRPGGPRTSATPASSAPSSARSRWAVRRPSRSTSTATG
ncbi:filamentous hemagglutinin N-terminal domain-containing protein [Azospirillum brasilense]|uniref:two-partner secretion domain-containing protein n=1 Tax=Azospirillum brasilense TaxID=192 RepID=UPI0009ECBE63|nr:filamentous hemagglutinin N-terminal domain-containing protein [Azospirillum brasilense]